MTDSENAPTGPGGTRTRTPDRGIGVLIEVAPELWTTEQMITLPGWVKMPVRMTVARLPRGGLVVHSPLALTDDLLRSVARIDKVEHLLAPSCLHHRFAGEWLRRFAGAPLWGAPGLSKQRKDLAFAGVLSGSGDTPWSSVLDQMLIEGAPGLNELVFLHRSSRSLLVSDLLFNIRRPANFPARIVLTLMGTRGRLAMSRAWHRFTKDREALRASIEKLLAWDFERILPGHGAIYEHPQARKHAQAALAWALETKREARHAGHDVALPAAGSPSPRGSSGEGNG